MARGIFIVIDGIDGSGKGEIVKRLHNHLFSKSKSYSILTTREPTSGIHGMNIRKILETEKNPDANAGNLLELFIKDREEHVKNAIVPFLKNDDGGNKNIVLCDRYYHSTIAFQSTQGLEIKELIRKNEKFPKPDITFILDLEPETALKRMSGREKEKFENLDFMKRLRKKFLELPKLLNEKIIVVDASKSPDRVFESIKEEVDKVL